MTRRYTRRLLLLIPAAELDSARSTGRIACPTGLASRSMTCPLSPTGLGPPTHWAAAAQLTARQETALRDAAGRNAPLLELVTYSLDDPAAVEGALASRGLRRCSGASPELN